MDSTLVTIIKHYEQYKKAASNASGSDNLAQFSAFLSSQVESDSDYSQKVSIENWQQFNRKTLLEMSTAYIGKMARYVDNYSRKNLPQTALGSVEEFTYLIVLLEGVEMTKSDLIKRNGHAVTTGTDIIKRLLKKDFVQQISNPSDKRSYMIQITNKGKNAIFSSSETMNQLSLIGAGILSNKELIQLVSILQKLDIFHEKAHDEHKSLDLTEIINSYKEKLHIGTE